MEPNLSTRAVYQRMKQHWLDGGGGLPEELCADDIVVETPFAPPGSPGRIEGREEWLAFARAGRASLPVRFDRCSDVAIHETTDPDVIVVEYELGGTVTTTGGQASAVFIGVLRVRHGRVQLWREYQDVPAIAAALGR